MPEDADAITAVVFGGGPGQPGAAARLMGIFYFELHQIAAGQMRRERRDHTLQTTALVHEVYLRLCGSDPATWSDRDHFYAVAAQQLRRVLVDHARRVNREKRGGGQVKVALCDFDGKVPGIDEGMLALDESLCRLQDLDARAAKVVELRFFAGLKEDEIANAL